MNGGSSFGAKASKLFLVVTGAMSGVALGWVVLNMVDLRAETGYIERDKELFKQISSIVPTLETYVQAGITAKARQEEQSKGNWLTFFDNTASTAGISSDQYVLPSPREVKGRNFVEYRFDMKLKNVRRRETARFLWEVEKRRSFLKSAEVKLQRPKKTADEVWEGQVVIAYREKQ